jgi:hypothetical protein
VDDDLPFAGQSRGSPRSQERKRPATGFPRSRPDRRRPQNVAAGGKLLVPALGDALRFGARRSVGNLPLGVDGNVEARVRTPMSAVSANRCHPQSGRAPLSRRPPHNAMAESFFAMLE